MSKPCKECGEGVNHEFWWDCPNRSRKTVNYGWRFARGQNEARKADFFAKAESDPFGVDA